MIPDNLRFGGGPNTTFLHPAVALAVLIAGLLMVFLPRRKAAIPFLFAAVLLPADQVLLLGGLHFPMIRALLLFGFVRLIKARFFEHTRILRNGVNRLDLAVILLSVVAALNALLLWQQSQALVAQFGELFTVFGAYFFLRYAIREKEDAIVVIRTLAGVAAIAGTLMVYEQATGSNPYASLGGARAAVYAVGIERDGHVRAMASFAHPILAGTFGAVLIPLFVGLWLSERKYFATVLIGVIGASAMTLACNSSTPLLGYIAGALALCLWPIRNYMRIIRWGVVATVIGLHLVMKAPVWNLIARIDLTGGSSSYHRFMLVDGFIRHFDSWWMFGTKSNSEWGWCMWDQANQYVAVGQTSGLLPFLLFIAIITYGFKFLGRARRASGVDKKTQIFLWALGCALFANAVAFFGISYFDQTVVAWYALLGMISTVALQRRNTVEAKRVIEFSPVSDTPSDDSRDDIEAVSPYIHAAAE